MTRATPQQEGGHLPRFAYLLGQPEDANPGRARNHAMKDIDRDNAELEDVLPKNFKEISRDTIIGQNRLLQPIEFDGDAYPAA